MYKALACTSLTPAESAAASGALLLPQPTVRSAVTNTKKGNGKGLTTSRMLRILPGKAREYWKG